MEYGRWPSASSDSEGTGDKREYGREDIRNSLKPCSALVSSNVKQVR
jgi:hypothetical protein